MTTISITKARATLYDLIEEVSKKKKRIGLTNKGETKAVLISQAELESLEETLDLLSSNPNILQELKEAEEQVARGEYVTLEELEEELKIKRHKETSTHV
ncbi:MAG: hypothetical protein A3F61_00335 [Candidatus Blackburnbacteria bacterium RIFCSPHIGHO2_12_FULL_41_13b]|uniref:Antitoxin n=1 Tax=Candidatus Blackburnbacteria bacterium RIFCSPHIGHO2_12_FULL_41_13b TaxID=1797517 RepID=A0A1G1V6L0_9BACT|nr:MAG: hypothetical protein A3F61_00335 [Candidatus Blackburnbacteria bacterium RIFCSPHIGHO2_12_FULL_41_13b]